ncbi:MAG: MerR family transcriptional regulator [Saprospirales bacterium]|jgi:DNA-binding transcriptional MerR regulator|nr:MAG: MerR family transcriptional regulator [Saprospirales bacterium]
MIDTEKLTKHYYTTSEVAELFDVSNSLIRYWETEFHSLRPNKNTKGERRFTRKNIEQIALIYHLVKEKGYTLEGARKEMVSQKEYFKEKNTQLKKLANLKDGISEIRELLKSELDVLQQGNSISDEQS